MMHIYMEDWFTMIKIIGSVGKCQQNQLTLGVNSTIDISRDP